MHRDLCDYIDRELKDIDRKAANGKLTMQEIEYADKLAHIKKSLLTNEAMEGAGYSRAYPERYYPDDYERGRRSDGRYSRAYHDGDMMDELRKMMDNAPSDQMRRKIRDFMNEVKTMM